MAAGISIAASTRSFRLHRNPFSRTKPNISKTPFLRHSGNLPPTTNATFTIFFVANGRIKEGTSQTEEVNMDESRENTDSSLISRENSEWYTHLTAAVMCSVGIISIVVLAVYFRSSWQFEGGDVPVSEILGTFAFSIAAAIGMEFLSRWTHRELWHSSLWHIHESHHSAREGNFELNDVFAIINAVPAIALLNFGFFHQGIVPALCFGAGLGITVLGMAYIFVHNGIVHQRFPVGPVANIPYLHQVAAAHQIHHSGKFQGIPYGLFLGPKELEEAGAAQELDKVINRRIKQMK